jgi:hypothetical protein
MLYLQTTELVMAKIQPLSMRQQDSEDERVIWYKNH